MLFSRWGSAGAVAASRTLTASVRSGSPIAWSGLHGARQFSAQVLMGDGQVSQGDMVVKSNAVKVRVLDEGVLAGYAGSTADAFTLIERLESKLEENEGQLVRACVSLATDWRTDKYLRRLEATLVVADSRRTFQVTGLGDVLEPRGGTVAVGSGQPYALAAARALMLQEGLNAREVAQTAMEIAAELCVYTNSNFTSVELEDKSDEPEEDDYPRSSQKESAGVGGGSEGGNGEEGKGEGAEGAKKGVDGPDK